MREKYIKPELEITYFDMAERIMTDVTAPDPDGDGWNAGVNMSSPDTPPDLPPIDFGDI